MKPSICMLLALFSLALSILWFGNLLVSCSGHPPITAVGMWIIPLSLLGGAVFLYLSIFFWKARCHQASGLLKKEAKLLPKKVVVFFASFIIGATAYLLLTFIILALAVNTTLPDWISYILYASFALIAIYVGVTIYKRFAGASV